MYRRNEAKFLKISLRSLKSIVAALLPPKRTILLKNLRNHHMCPTRVNMYNTNPTCNIPSKPASKVIPNQSGSEPTWTKRTLLSNHSETLDAQGRSFDKPIVRYSLILPPLEEIFILCHDL